MLQITIIKYDLFNDSLCSFLANMLRIERTNDEKKFALYDWCKTENYILDIKYEIQEINNCYLIYRGLDHLMTIKFEL